MKKQNHKKKGQQAETIATQYLQQIGYKILARNVRYKQGEIDIVALDKDQIVFVEVRSRWTKKNSNKKIRPEDTITFPKQRRLTYAAMLFLSENNIHKSARFDAIGVHISSKAILSHYKNAFEATNI